VPFEPVLKEQINIEKKHIIVIRFIYIYMNENVLRIILILRSLHLYLGLLGVGCRAFLNSDTVIASVVHNDSALRW